jgi:hypothetical protein
MHRTSCKLKKQLSASQSCVHDRTSQNAAKICYSTRMTSGRFCDFTQSTTMKVSAFNLPQPTRFPPYQATLLTACALATTVTGLHNKGHLPHPFVFLHHSNPRYTQCLHTDRLPSAEFSHSTSTSSATRLSLGNSASFSTVLTS